jgi:hypothetical protein
LLTFTLTGWPVGLKLLWAAIAWERVNFFLAYRVLWGLWSFSIGVLFTGRGQGQER